jgi:hypothetical protein
MKVRTMRKRADDLARRIEDLRPSRPTVLATTRAPAPKPVKKVVVFRNGPRPVPTNPALRSAPANAVPRKPLNSG